MRVFLFFVVSFCICLSLFAQETILSGKVTDEDGELISANIGVYTLEGEIATGTTTDFDGNYSVELEPGKYNIEFSYIGYPDNRIENVIVIKGKVNNLNVDMTQSSDEQIDLSCCCCIYDYPAIIDFENSTSGSTYDSEQVSRFR